MNVEYRVRYSNGVERGPFGSYEEARENVLKSYPEAEIGHDGDITQGGDRTLCWASGEESVDDDGQRAIASIWAHLDQSESEREDRHSFRRNHD